MKIALLFYKKCKGIVQPVDYINWAAYMLKKDVSSPSLGILASLYEPYNIFEVEDYFLRACKELCLQAPIYEECVKAYMYELLKKILHNNEEIFKIADELYLIICEHFSHEELSIWFDISEKADDFRYGDNTSQITKEKIQQMIVEAARHILESNFFGEYTG